MATLGGTVLTLLDYQKTLDPDGKISKIIEILDQTNELISYVTYEECNDGSSHQHTIRTGLPAPTARRYNQGVAPSKGTTAQVRSTTAQYESVSVVDRDLAHQGGNEKEFRATASVAEIEGMGQQVATDLIYGDERVTSEKFTGLAAHYATANPATAKSAENVIDAAGTGSDNCSIYLACFGPWGVTGLIPTGAQHGLVHEDRGEQRIIDATGPAGASFIGLEDRFFWKLGFAVKDWTQCVRIANIDVPALRSGSGAANLIKDMIVASERIRNKNLGRCAWIMNRTARTALRLQKLDRGVNMIDFDTVEGRKVMHFDEIPIAATDALINSEARVV